MAEQAAAKGAASLLKALRLLDIAAEHPEGVSLAELARLTGHARPTVYRIAAALVGDGYLQQDDSTRKVTLGPKLLDLAQNVWRDTDLRTAAQAELQRLTRDTGATALLMVRSGAVATCIELSAGAAATWRVGEAFPVTECAGGLAMLAYGDWERLDSELTALGLVDAHAFKSRLGVTRSRFYALDAAALPDGRRGVAAPIFDFSGKPIAAVCLYGDDTLPVHDLGAAVVQAARLISRRRGGYPFGINVPNVAVPRDVPHVTCLAPEKCLIGDNPVVADGRIAWIDILAPAIHSRQDATGALDKTQLGEVVGAFIALGDQRFLLAQQTRLAIVGLDGAEIWSRAVSGLPAGFRYNDGATDDRGRVWLGAMDMATSRGTGLLHRYDTLEGDPVTLPGFSLPNGIAFSRDGAAMLVVDSMERTLSRYRYDHATGDVQLDEKHPLLAQHDGRPSGLARGPGDSFFTCHWDGAEVVQLDSQGRRIAAHPVPVPRPSGVTYDAARNRLIVTSARVRLSDPDVEAFPLSGGVFQIHLPAGA